MTDAIAALHEARRELSRNLGPVGVEHDVKTRELIARIDAALASVGDEVTVDELATELRGCDSNNDEMYEEQARALLSKFHMHKRAEG